MSKQETAAKGDKEEKKSKKKFILPIIIILLFIAWVGHSIVTQNGDSAGSGFAKPLAANGDSSALDSGFVEAVTEADTEEIVIRTSVPINENYKAGIDEEAGKNVRHVYEGRRINIAVIGLDARLGTVSNHADANHILSIMPDSGVVEITAIPRDTYADAGMSDSSGQNKLTIVRANRGRKAYLREAARIARLDNIPYYVEVGFSQVMGLLELFGVKDSRSGLQVLRSRKGLGGDDFQRCYNQAQFIRQMMLRHFGKVAGTFGDVIIRGGLAFVETNLTAKTVSNIVEQLKDRGFGDRPEDVCVRVRPALGMKFKVHDFTQQEVFDELKKRIENHNVHSGEEASKTVNVANRLWTVIKSASADSAKSPSKVVRKLETYFNQRAWMQVPDHEDRAVIRTHISDLLASAYRRTKKEAKAAHVEAVIKAEEELFAKPL